MTEGTVTREARRFRARAVALEEAARREVLARYERVLHAITAEAEAVEARIRRARAAGAPESAAWIYQTERLQLLREQTLIEVTRWSRQAVAAVEAAREAAATTAPGAAADYLAAVSPFTVQLPDQAVLQAVAHVNTTAVRQLFASMPLQVAGDLGDVLASGIAVGDNPRLIARRMRAVADVPAHRAATVARTEVMRTWREASREAYLHDPIVDGWRWWSALSRRTCASCWAQHGSVHPATEVMATHPNCRCVQLPVTRPWRTLGVAMDEPPVTAGPVMFDRQPEAAQRAVLGPAKYEAYAAGDIQLGDLIRRRFSPTWGPSTSEGSLRAARAASAARGTVRA